ncbi:MAG: TIGR04282 family arsenosugar biosynthesis glycosyltransferase [Verrucomicrobia bacterium]|nr:TIGR04282 family arsenosugar biosynthesis glycosyltransferase [Verrucomicrobiota bacterium]
MSRRLVSNAKRPREGLKRNEMNLRQLIVFLKAPRVGVVKTRLAESIGAEAACAAYRRLVEILVVNLSALDQVELRFTPNDAVAEMQPWLRNGWRCTPQGAGDLGARLQRAFTEAFAAGAARVVIIGSDCPAVTEDDIADAWRMLETHEVVLGPARDGGYWLVGLREPQPALFGDMIWSTSTVLSETLRRAERSDLRAHLLRELADVDTLEDWQEFLRGHATNG